MQFKIPEDELTILRQIGTVSDRNNIDCYLVGGFVRDLMLKRRSKDIDVVCLGDGIELAKKVSRSLPGNPGVSIFKNFGTANINFKGWDIEFVGARKESYQSHSRKPIVENGSLEDDQLRRDFTINALAISLNESDFGQLTDPFNGVDDLEKGIIRTPREPEITFSDDPLRMMRAVRFAAQLDFYIDDSTYEGISKSAERIRIVSFERIIDELNKIILTKKPSIGFKHLYNTGVLQHIFPEMTQLHGVEIKNGKAHKDNFYHTLQVLDNLSSNTNDLWLRWAAILHDIAKPATKRFNKIQGWTFHGHEAVGSKMVPQIFRKMKLPLNEKMKFVQKMVFLHLRPISLTKENITDSALRRLLYEAGDDIDSLMLLCEADITSKNKKKVARYLENFEMVRQKLDELEEKDRIRNWQPPVDGGLIMSTFGIRPSREVGIIKNAIREAILDGEIKNNFEEAFQFMLEKGSELGLVQVEETNGNSRNG